jgi:UDP-N-acetylmuramate dehydrogenase
MSPAQAGRWNLRELLRDIPARKVFGKSLAPYTSLRIGGPVDALVQVDDLDVLKRVLAVVNRHEIPLSVLGGGSNVLIRDCGVRGILLLMRGAFRSCRLQPHADGKTADLKVGAGYPLSRLAMQVGRSGWSGLEFAYGIPGTVGGAMVMNSGTGLGDVSDTLLSARVLCRNGELRDMPVSAAGLGYRSSAFPQGAVLLEATLRLQRGNAPVINSTMRGAYGRRRQTQPLALPSAGSTFTNPEGRAAGQLIERLGLKGTRFGGAQISPLHANFITNIARATAADVETLIGYVRDRVKEAYGISLTREVRILGEKG